MRPYPNCAGNAQITQITHYFNANNMEDSTQMGAPDAEGDSNENKIEIPERAETKDPSDIWGGDEDGENEGVSEKHAPQKPLMGDE